MKKIRKLQTLEKGAKFTNAQQDAQAPVQPTQAPPVLRNSAKGEQAPPAPGRGSTPSQRSSTRGVGLRPPSKRTLAGRRKFRVHIRPRLVNWATAFGPRVWAIPFNFCKMCLP